MELDMRCFKWTDLAIQPSGNRQHQKPVTGHVRLWNNLHNAILVFFNKNVSIYKIRSKFFKHQANHSAKRPHWFCFYFCFFFKVFYWVLDFYFFLNHVIHFPYWYRMIHNNIGGGSLLMVGMGHIHHCCFQPDSSTWSSLFLRTSAACLSWKTSRKEKSNLFLILPAQGCSWWQPM